MNPIEFTKMQGLGNDFVVLDGPIELTREMIRELCDRRFGIGADGVLVVTAGDPVVMGYWNADGSAAEMCGNGLRCVARYARDRGLVAADDFEVDTPAGVRKVHAGHVIEVEIGPVSVSGHRKIDGRLFHVIDVGNPHAVVMVDDPESEDVSSVGSGLQDEFEGGVNVEFAHVSDDTVSLRVWERGVGETMACGTGMAAAAFVATKTDGLESPVHVEVPGRDSHRRLQKWGGLAGRPGGLCVQGYLLRTLTTFPINSTPSLKTMGS